MGDPKPRSGTVVTQRTVEGVQKSLPGYTGAIKKQIQPLTNQFLKSDTQLNPEFYQTRAQTGGKIGELLGSINLNDANPEAERLISQEAARSGTLNNPQNATNTLANALSFGRELEGRRQSLGNAIGAASGFLPLSRTNFNAVDSASGLGRDILGASTGAQLQKDQLNAQRQTAADKAIGSIESILGSC